jgi:hypothetical protein
MSLSDNIALVICLELITYTGAALFAFQINFFTT